MSTLKIIVYIIYSHIRCSPFKTKQVTILLIETIFSENCIFKMWNYGFSKIRDITYIITLVLNGTQLEHLSLSSRCLDINLFYYIYITDCHVSMLGHWYFLM